MKRLWLKISGFRIHNVRYFDGSKNQIRVDVRLKEAFNVRRVLIARKEGSETGIIQNWAMANICFFDGPAFHHKNKKEPLLQDVLVIALAEEGWSDIVPLFLRDELSGSMGDVEYVRPTTWSGKSLRIPVDFIQLRNFSCPLRGPAVFADFVIGRHIIIPQVQIFDGTDFVFDPDCRVIDKGLRILAERLMKRQTLRELAHSVFESGIGEISREFTLTLKYCDLKGTPPAIRFY